MKQRMRAMAAMVILILLLAGCGRFAIEGQVMVEATPTATIDSTELQVNPEATAGSIIPPAPSTADISRLPRFGLAEILFLTGLLLVASFILGAYLLITGRPLVLDVRPMQAEHAEPATLLSLLRFRPNVWAVLLSLCTWTFTLSIVAVFIIIGMALLARSNVNRDADITLTVPSAIMLTSSGRHVTLPLSDLECTLDKGTDREQLLCEMMLDDQMLTLDVVLIAGTFWECTSTYEDKPVPCRASFSDEDLQTYVILESALGLSDIRIQQLISAQPTSGPSAARWLDLAWVMAGACALAACAILWRHSRARIDRPSQATSVLAATYSIGASLTLFWLVYCITVLALLLFGVVA